MKPKQLVSHGNTHKLGDKCELCDRVKREVSMEDVKKPNTLTTRNKRVNLNMTSSRKPNKDCSICNENIKVTKYERTVEGLWTIWGNVLTARSLR